jgi:hypothetical protein
LKDLENEVFVWTGHPHELDDQIDVLSNASHMVTILSGEDQFDSSLSGADNQEGASAVFPSFSRPF